MNEVNKHSGSIISLKDIATGVVVDLISTSIKSLISEVKKIIFTSGKDIKNKKDSEKKQKSSKEFEKFIEKIKVITYEVMANIVLRKRKPLSFGKNEDGKEIVALYFAVENKGCFIHYTISELNKKKLLETSLYQIVESFIFQRLLNYGKNDYLDEKCPECKQITLTKASVINDPNEEAIACNLCGWAGFMITYNKYLSDKKNNPFLEFPKWWKKRNNYEI